MKTEKAPSETEGQGVGASRRWTFGAFYFLSFAAVAFPGIYGNLFLERSGVSKIELGVLGAISAWVGTLSPPIWGIITDALRRRRIPLFVMHLAGAALYPLFWFWADGPFLLLCVLMGAFSFFFRAGIPLTDAWTLSYIGRHGGDYGRLRSWGSVGFILPLFASIFVLKGSEVTDAAALLPIFFGFSGFRLLSALFTFALPEDRPSGERPKLDFRGLRAYLRPFAIVFLFASFMSRFVFGPYYTFFSIYLDEIGIADNVKGLFWIVAVGAEVGLIAVSGRLLRRFGTTPMLLAGLGAMAVRLYIFSLTPPWVVVLGAQTLHALTFGAFHVASMQIIHRITPESLKASGQTFYGTILGVGGILGGIVGGTLAEAYGIAMLFRVLSFAALGAGLVTWIGFRRFGDEEV